MQQSPPAHPAHRWLETIERVAVWVFAVGMTLSLTLILSLNLGGSSQYSVIIGQPAPSDIFSPRSLTFNSDLLTDQAREQARRSVPQTYTALDLAIGRAQLARARDVLSFLDVVRADGNASLDRKLEYMRAIDGLSIDDQLARDVLSLSQADFDEVRADILRIIEELMRQEIRPNELTEFQRVARQLAGLELTAVQTNVVTGLVYQFVVPTVFPDDDSTQAARQDAADAIEPVTRTIARDQRIVRAGDIVTEADYELLQELGLLQQETNLRQVGALAIFSFLVVALTTLYWVRYQQQQFGNGRYLAMLAGLMLIFALAARIMTVSESLSYWYPLAALSMLLAVVFDVRFAVLLTALMAGLAGVIRPNSLELTTYLAVGGLLSILTLKDAQRVGAFFRGGLLAAAGHILVLVAFWLTTVAETPSPRLIAFGVGNGILSSGLTLAGFYILGGLFGIVTILQLQDLSRLDHPLLRELLRRAPGTYHHSIMVANLAEQAAERIGANSTLVRVGSFYHDVGKVFRPPFFTENQEGANPHDALDPYTSARLVMSHVGDGLELARRYRLPFRIRDIIAEHHGTRIVKSFFRKAQEQAGEDAEEVDIRFFRYAGPRPRTRESGIVMLADAIDAASSAVRPNTEKAIEKLVNSIVEEDILGGQLERSGLTLGDVEQLRISFIETLKGRFHVRVQYPGNEELLAANAVPVLGPGEDSPAALATPQQTNRYYEQAEVVAER